MASLDLLIDLQLDVAGPSVQVPSFGIPLVAGYFTTPAWAERVRYFGSLADVLADGHAVNTAIYRACAAVFAQNPAPAQVGVGRCALPSTNCVEVTPIVANSRLYTLDVLGVDGVLYTASYTSDSSALLTEITAGLTSAINALAAGAAVTATDGGTKVTVLADVAGTYFAIASGVLSNALLTFAQTHADPGIATDLAAVSAEDSAWYGVTLANDQGAATLTAAAAWCGTNKKQFFNSSQDSAIAAAGSADVVSVVKATSDDYATVAFHRRAGFESLGGAVLGLLYSHDPGSINLHGKRLVGITADALTGTELAYITAKYGLSYTTYGSLPMLREGRATSGQWIDVVRDLDWVHATMQADCVDVLASNLKVPYTDGGASLLGGAVRARLAIAQTNGVFDAGWTVLVPKVATAAPADKANRIFRTIKWAARLAGGINKGVIRGTVTY